MDHTRSGRKVKRSSRFLDMEQDFNEFELGNFSGDDLDYNLNEDNSSDGSADDINGDDDAYSDVPRQSKRVPAKTLSMEGLTWKNGILIPAQDSSMILPPVKPRQKRKTKMADEIIDRIPVPKDDPALRFYSVAIDSLKHSNLSYTPITPRTADDSGLLNQPCLDLINDERFNLKLEPKNQSLIPKYDKSNDKINEMMGISLDMEDLQRYTRLTGYILYTIVCKRKTESNVSDIGLSHRKMQENWTAIPERTKRDWEIKAKQVKKLVDNKRRNDQTEDVSKKEKRRIALKKAEENIRKAKAADHNMADLAFYLKTVGEGMSKLSTKVTSHKGPVGLEGVESVLLDYLLCSLISLVGIFEDSEGLDKAVTTDSLNKLTFVIPGLN